MNDTDRLLFIDTIQRLNNWIARTRLPPSEFIKAGSNRALFDDLIQPALAPLVPKPPKPRRQKTHWRRWVDLPQTEQDRLVTKLARRAAKGGRERSRDRDAVALFLARRRILAGGSDSNNPGPDVPRLYHAGRGFISSSYSTKTFAGFPVSWISRNHTIKPLTNTPAERLYDRRRAAFNRAIAVYKGSTNYDGTANQLATPTFVLDLHPDDVELATDSVVVSAQLRKLHDLFTERNYPPLQGTKVEEFPLAASLFLTDVGEQVQVYYCALLVGHRSAPPTLERAYVARAFSLAEQQWRVNGRFKRASNALAAGLKLYGEGVAAHIHQPAAGEGTSK